MAYPTIPQALTTSVTYQNGLNVSRSTGGTLRAVSHYNADKAIIQCNHTLITDVQKEELDTFYSGNRLTPFEWVYSGDDSIRTVIFTNPPAYTWVAAGYWNVQVTMEEI